MPSVLVVMDVDSTVIEQEVIELLATHAGVEQEVRAITESAMRGELDFEASLRARVSQLAGLPVSVFDAVREAVRFTPGAIELCTSLQAAGHRVALVSGGFDVIVAHIAAELGITDYRANQLVLNDSVITGELRGDIVDRPRKASLLQEFAARYGIPMSRTIAVGDGANDIDMVEVAAIGVAFAAKPALRAVADVIIEERNLLAVLPLVNRLD